MNVFVMLINSCSERIGDNSSDFFCFAQWSHDMPRATHLNWSVKREMYGGLFIYRVNILANYNTDI